MDNLSNMFDQFAEKMKKVSLTLKNLTDTEAHAAHAAANLAYIFITLVAMFSPLWVSVALLVYFVYRFYTNFKKFN